MKKYSYRASNISTGQWNAIGSWSMTNTTHKLDQVAVQKLTLKNNGKIIKHRYWSWKKLGEDQDRLFCQTLAITFLAFKAVNCSIPERFFHYCYEITSESVMPLEIHFDSRTLSLCVRGLRFSYSAPMVITLRRGSDRLTERPALSGRTQVQRYKDWVIYFGLPELRYTRLKK